MMNRSCKKVSLKDYFKLENPALADILDVFIDLSVKLNDIHAQHIVHNNMNPDDIGVDITTKAVTMNRSDVAFSGTVKAGTTSTGRIQGDIHYMSPEKTGRTTQPVDFRSDYYALGMILYEALTGRVPFDLKNPMDIVYAHIAIAPRPVHEVNPDIPRVLSDIVLKLTAKNPDDRYQSMAGFIYDITAIKGQIGSKGKISYFPIGEKDRPRTFKIPEKIYGRPDEINMLLCEYQQVVQGDVRIVLIHGGPGIGKTALIHETAPFMTTAGGWFLSGKFDPNKNSAPFSALSDAFSGLIPFMMTLDPSSYDPLIERIRKITAGYGQFILNIIPELEKVIGRPSSKTDLVEENSILFINVFKQFVRAIAKAGHPLVFFIDDLQWADHASLQYMDAILSDNLLSNLFFIGTYRDVEAKENQASKMFLEKLEKQPRSTSFMLRPMDSEDVGLMVGDMMKETLDSDDPFVKLIMEKTNGNPLFIREFLIHLHTHGLIQYHHNGPSPHPGRWWIDMDGALNTELPDSIVVLLTERIQKLKEGEKDVLKIAACLGKAFTADVPALIQNRPLEDMTLQLKTLCDQGLLVEAGEGFRFVHDRVKETVYALNGPQEKQAIHYKAGKALQAGNAEATQTEDIFSLAYQFNAARGCLSPKELYELVEINTKAGSKARQMAAYEEAFAYFEAALDLLGEDAWFKRYALTKSIHSQAAESAFLSTDFRCAEQLADCVCQHARTFEDTIQAQEIRIRAKYAQDKRKEAINDGLDVLKRVGIEHPKNPGRRHVIWGFLTTAFHLALSRKSLYKLKDSTDPTDLIRARIGTLVGHFALFTDFRLFILIILQSIKSTLRHGKAPESTSSIASLGNALCARTPFIDAGYRLCRQALSMVEKDNMTYWDIITMLRVNALSLHFKHHVKETFMPLVNTFRSGLDTGNIEAACTAITQYLHYLSIAGDSVETVCEQIIHYNDIIRQYDHTSSLAYNNMLHQQMLNWMGKSDCPWRLSGDVYNEEKMRPVHIAASDEMGLCRLSGTKMILNYAFGRYVEAVQYAEEMATYQQLRIGSYDATYMYMWDSLSRLALLDINPPGLDSKNRRRHLRKVANNQKKLKRWVRRAPMNFRHLYTLVAAERARILKKNDHAETYYHQAISLSRQYDYLPIEALANELLAKFYVTQNNNNSAKQHFQKAFELNRKWGAMAKCRHLKETHASFFPEPQNQAETGGAPDYQNPPLCCPEMNSSDLDLGLFVNMMDANLNSTSAADQLGHGCEAIMTLSGAKRSVLFFIQEGKAHVKWDRSIEETSSDHIEIRKTKTPLFPETMIHYVMRTRDVVILEDATKAGAFSADPYIKVHGAKSVLCMPLMRASRLIAILYLENKLNKGVFIRKHLKPIKGLCAQVFLGMENDLKDNAHIIRNTSSMTPEMLMESLKQHYGLTPQEARVAALFKEGHTRSDICETLNITNKTLKRHLQLIYDKTLNMDEEFIGEGRIDKLSRLILFLFKHSEYNRVSRGSPYR